MKFRRRPSIKSYPAYSVISDSDQKAIKKRMDNELAEFAKFMKSQPYMYKPGPVQGRANTKGEKWKIILRLYRLWVANSDLRLSQLIGNVYPCGPTQGHVDPYNVEDEHFINTLETSYKGE